MPVVEEEVVIEKRPVVKEEIRLRKEVVEEEEIIEENVRKEEVDIDYRPNATVGSFFGFTDGLEARIGCRRA